MNIDSKNVQQLGYETLIHLESFMGRWKKQIGIDDHKSRRPQPSISHLNCIITKNLIGPVEIPRNSSTSRIAFKATAFNMSSLNLIHESPNENPLFSDGPSTIKLTRCRTNTQQKHEIKGSEIEVVRASHRMPAKSKTQATAALVQRVKSSKANRQKDILRQDRLPTFFAFEKRWLNQLISYLH